MQQELRGAIQELRNEIAHVETIIKSFPLATGDRLVAFRSQTIVQLAFARGWLGKVLGLLGNPTPYPKSDDPTSQAIEPPAYKAEPYPKTLQNAEDWISGIKEARQCTNACLDHWAIYFGGGFENADMARYAAMSKSALESARLMLGEELGILGGH